MFKRNVMKRLTLALAFAGGAAMAMPSLAGVSTQRLAQWAIAPAFPGNATVSVAGGAAGAYDAQATARAHIAGAFPGSGADRAAATAIENWATCRVSGQQIVQRVIAGSLHASC